MTILKCISPIDGSVFAERQTSDAGEAAGLIEGRPIRYGGEFGGVDERASYMADIAERALAPIEVEDSVHTDLVGW